MWAVCSPRILASTRLVGALLALSLLAAENEDSFCKKETATHAEKGEKMRITDIKLRVVTGMIRKGETPSWTQEEFWEERQIRPIDVYRERQSWDEPSMRRTGGKEEFAHEAAFLEIRTDDKDGHVGLGGPMTVDVARIIDADFRRLLEGADPNASELIWDQMYRQSVHGRKGNTILAISVVDCALWDLRGKKANMPVYKLLGGPVRKSFPAYASMLGFSLEPELVRERAEKYAKEEGYVAQKWFFRDGPTNGYEGIRRNEALVSNVREAVGEDYDIMFDAWSSWNIPYTIMMAERLAEHRPRWIEEPVLADKVDSCAEIRRRSAVPIATGEHEYTRWGIKALLDARAADVIQPDIYWCGGISEMQKIAALCSAYDVPLIPHGHSTHANAHFIAAQPPTLCPMLEYLVKWNEVHQHFFRYPLKPVNGVITVPDRPGMGTELDESKIISEWELRKDDDEDVDDGR